MKSAPDSPGSFITLTAGKATDAYIEWAQQEITSISDVRFEVAKLFFTATITAIAFFATAWKFLHPSATVSGPISWCLIVLLLATIFDLFLFWPEIHRVSKNTDLQRLHDTYVQQLVVGGVGWAGFWVVGVILGLYAILF